MEFKDHCFESAHWDALKSIVEQVTVTSYLEIGVREGGSLAIVLDCPTLKYVVLCDDWSGTYGGTSRGSEEYIHRMIGERKWTGTLLVLSGDSKIHVPKLASFPGCPPFDLVLVDGDHSYAGAGLDLINSWPLLKAGGLLVMDDIWNAGHPYLDEVFHNFAKLTGAEIVYEEHGPKPNGVGVLRKS